MPNEASKIRDRIMPLLEGKTVLDLGCGDEKVVPWAVGVDDWTEWLPTPKIPPPAVNAPIDEGRAVLLSQALYEGGFPEEEEYEVVFSSHAIEHLRIPIPWTLHYWLRFVKPGGRLVLYLPDENFYQFDKSNPKRRNPAHLHYLTADTFRWYVDQLEGVEVERYEMDLGPNRYSFLVILRKK